MVAHIVLPVLKRMVLAEEDDDCQCGACSIALNNGGDDAGSRDGNHGRVQGGQGAECSDEVHTSYDELRPCSQRQVVDVVSAPNHVSCKALGD